MTKFKIFSAAAMLSLMFATPVFAQAAIQEPGAFAFYYPNMMSSTAAGLRRRRAWTPGAGAVRQRQSRDDTAADRESYAARYRSFDPASGTFLGRDGAGTLASKLARSIHAGGRNWARR